MSLLRESRDRRARVERRKILAAALAGSLLMLFLAIAPDLLRRLILPGAAAAWKAQALSARALDAFFGLLRSKYDLLLENRALRADLAELEGKLLDRNLLAEENSELKLLLNRPDARESVLGVVLVHPPQSPYDTLIIDVGRARGITRGDLVIAGENIPLGRVNDVAGETALVTLFSTAGERTTVRIEGVEAPIEALGRGGGNFSARIPGEASLAHGALVRIPSIAANVLGVVRSAAKEESGAYTEVVFTTPVNIFEIDKVRIVKGHSNEQ